MPPQINVLSFQLHICLLVVLNISCLQIKSEHGSVFVQSLSGLFAVAVFKSIKISTENQHTIDSNCRKVNKKSIHVLHGKLDCNVKTFQERHMIIFEVIKGSLHLWKDECVFKVGNL